MYFLDLVAHGVLDVVEDTDRSGVVVLLQIEIIVVFGLIATVETLVDVSGGGMEAAQ